MYVLLDECYVYLSFNGELVSGASFTDCKEHIVVLGSLSKTYAMTGWRAGFASRAEADHRRDEQAAVAEHVEHGEHGAAGVDRGTDIEPGLCERDAGGLHHAARPDSCGVQDDPRADLHGAGRCVLCVSERVGVSRQRWDQGLRADLAAKLLSEAHVVVVPGEAFGTSEHIRLSYAVSADVIDKGVERLREFFGAVVATVGGRSADSFAALRNDKQETQRHEQGWEMKAGPKFAAVILAGGSGTRFWPRSRRAMAKQVLAIEGERSMIQDTLARLKPVAGADHVWVITNDWLREVIEEQMPEVPAAHVLAEPAPRNTRQPACALAAFLLEATEPETVVGVFPSDHVVKNNKRFAEVVATGARLAAKGDNIVVLGVKPTRAETGYGYIEEGGLIDKSETARGFAPISVHRVKRRFRRSPTPRRPSVFCMPGNYVWNAGIFLWSVKNAVRGGAGACAGYGTAPGSDCGGVWYG